MFNPETRKYVWDVCKKNYYDYGINAFWLDNSEPDYGVYDFDHYRYIEGPALSCSNIYPQLYSRVFYDKKKKTDRVKTGRFFLNKFPLQDGFLYTFFLTKRETIVTLLCITVIKMGKCSKTRKHTKG